MPFSARAEEAVATGAEQENHWWSIGPGYRAAIISVRTSDLCDRSDIEALVPSDLGMAHLTVEIQEPEGEG